jgi:acetyl esterase
MPLHPQVKEHLDRLGATNFADLHAFTPDQVRQGMQAMLDNLPEPESVASVVDRIADTAAGELAMRVYHPRPGERLPVIVFFHGGGFVLGGLETHDGLARALANRSESVVVAVDYPLAPEHKYPAAPDAAIAATIWVAENGAAIGADSARLAVAGDSAGGNLAAVVALKAREAGAPQVAFQLLIYPDLDFRRSNYSIREFAGKYGNVGRATQGWFMDHYLSSEEEKLDPLVSPLLAPDLSGLPAALIVTAEYDALRDEGEAYGNLLAEAGVEVTVKRYDGMIHEFMRWPFDDAGLALDDAAEALRSAFDLPPTLCDGVLGKPSRSVQTAEPR